VSISVRTRALAATITALTAALVLAAGPANAAAPARGSADASAEACWLDADTGRLQCFDSEADLDAAVLAQTGSALVEVKAAPDATARAAFGARASYVAIRVYDGASYGGASTTVSTTNAALCTTGPGLSANFLASWNDRVSSWHTYLSCTTRVYVDAGQTGTYHGYVVDAPALGAVDNRGTSYSII
jgi:hypothetical protein